MKCIYGHNKEYTGTIIQFVVVGADVRAIVMNSISKRVSVEPLHILTITKLKFETLFSFSTSSSQ